MDKSFEDKIFIIIENAYRFNSKPKDTYNKIINLISDYIITIQSQYKFSNIYKEKDK